MEELSTQQVNNILKNHKEYFYKKETLNIDFRIEQLKKLREAIIKYEDKISEALRKDLGKGNFESYSSEIGFELVSIKNTIKNLKKWAKVKKVKTPIYLYPSKSYIMREPYGTVLIIGPYNYPFQLTIEPLIGAIAGGNTVVLKPSELTPNVSKVILDMISETFNENYISVVEGAIETTTSLINSKFDYIFFTGSVNVGKIVMEAASKNLTPVTLELGGKSPVIVDKSASIEISCKRIIWGKTLNAGQTCVAPDYVFVHKDIKEEFINKCKEVIKEFYGEDIKNNNDFSSIVNERHFERIKNILEKDKEFIVYGGRCDKSRKFIEPTLICLPEGKGASMNEEIFGPVLPIIEYEDLDEVIKKINKGEKPLALYLFTNNKDVERKVLSSVSSGGVSINDTISHLINHNLPFGGVGNSGIGSYHGEYSFNTFTHEKSILKKGTKLNIDLVFPPYNKLSLIKKVFK